MTANDIINKIFDVQMETLSKEDLEYEIDVAEQLTAKAEMAVRQASAERDYQVSKACAMRRRLAEMRKK